MRAEAQFAGGEGHKDTRVHESTGHLEVSHSV